MKYFRVIDVQNGDINYYKADNPRQTNKKAKSFWNSQDTYCELMQVKVEEVKKEEFEKNVNR